MLRWSSSSHNNINCNHSITTILQLTVQDFSTTRVWYGSLVVDANLPLLLLVYLRYGMYISIPLHARSSVVSHHSISWTKEEEQKRTLVICVNYWIIKVTYVSHWLNYKK